MSVFLNESNLPSLSRWQDEVDQLKFGLILDPDWNIREDSGFRPCSLNGSLAGFEYIFSHASECEPLPALARHYDSGISFIWHSNLLDCAAALIAAAALANLVPSVLYDDETGDACVGSEAIAYVTPILADLKIFPKP